MSYHFERESFWTRFWHEPVRAERLAITRIFFGIAILTDQLFQFLQHFEDFFGPDGVGYAGLNDAWQLKNWRWSVLLFNTDNMTIVSIVFGLWMAATLGFLVGWRTRVMSVLVWFLTMCFMHRNPNIKNGGDDVLCAALFLLMLSPCGHAFSLDARRARRKETPGDSLSAPPLTPAWPVRLIQIQMCMIYLTTGLAKLVRAMPPFADDWGTWWTGESVYYVLNDCTMARRAYPEFPIPFWITAIATYMSVWFETLFPLLVLFRRTRKWTLWFGILFHIGIYLAIEVGWFSFYTMCLYGIWIPGELWDRVLGKYAPARNVETPHAAPDEKSNAPDATRDRQPQNGATK